MIDVAAFLLAFCSPVRAYFILCQLYERAVPECEYPIHAAGGSRDLSIFSQERLIQLTQSQLGAASNEKLAGLREFFRERSLPFVQGLCVARVNF
jgi:hypothetical protein